MSHEHTPTYHCAYVLQLDPPEYTVVLILRLQAANRQDEPEVHRIHGPFGSRYQASIEFHKRAFTMY